MKRHFLAVLLLCAPPLLAQAPSEHWKTIATPHFRFHYPAGYDEWTMRAASRMESVRADVVREIGFAPETVTDVLVMNPIADANGATLPLLGHPRIVLFTEPPDPESMIGEFDDWIDLLTVHETAHLIHLLRPSRNPLQSLAERVVPLNRITLGAPRWVLEGYATVVEGRITETGRPNGSMRAAILRKWAASGQLPSYAQLSSDRRFMGMSMAYLAGSAFLEWLEVRSGRPEPLRNLWARMTARQKRSFASAFEGVFGDSPERLYGLFTAELTQKSKIADAVEGDLWLETKRGSGEPAVSPDGSQIALVERDDKGESKLVIYSTGPNEEEKKLRERIEKILKRDPEDVAPVRVKPVPRKPKHTFRTPEGGDISSPRWFGDSILYTHKQPDRDGFLHHDLFVWSVDGNRRLTNLADVKDADPLPGGREAIAVRSRFGFTQLVKIDLQNGTVTDFTPPSIDTIVAHPRASADGRIAWSEHDATGWHIVVDGQRRGDGFDPEWGRDRALYSVMATGGFIDIMRNAERITRVAGAAIQPAPSADGSVYFMSLETDGFVVRRCLDCGGLPPPSVAQKGGGKPPHSKAELPVPHDYGFGRQERGFMFGGMWSAYDRRNELGVRLGDVVGRLDTIAIGTTDHEYALASTWRGWPIAVTAHAYRIEDHKGIEVRGEHEYHAPRFTTYLAAGASSRTFGIAGINIRQRKSDEMLRFALDSDHHWRAQVAASVRAGDTFFALSAAAGRRLLLGGFASSAVPDSYRIERVDDPALPAGFSKAANFRSLRADVVMGGASFFWQRYRLDRDVDVRGVEISFSAPPFALVKTAALDFTLGAAKVSDTRGIKGWIALRWRP